jgi:hypothetical protein
MRLSDHRALALRHDARGIQVDGLARCGVGRCDDEKDLAGTATADGGGNGRRKPPPPAYESLQWVTVQMPDIPTKGPAIMLGLEQWNSTLSGITGTLVRGTERITSSALFNALEVGPDPSTRQKVGKRTETSSPVPPARFSLSCSRAVVPVRCQPGLHTLQQSDGGMASAITC